MNERGSLIEIIIRFPFSIYASHLCLSFRVVQLPIRHARRRKENHLLLRIVRDSRRGLWRRRSLRYRSRHRSRGSRRRGRGEWRTVELPRRRRCIALLALSDDLCRQREHDLHGKMCRYNARKAKYNEVSEMLGYGLKIAKMASIVVITKSGCVRSRKHSPPT